MEGQWGAKKRGSKETGETNKSLVGSGRSKGRRLRATIKAGYRG